MIGQCYPNSYKQLETFEDAKAACLDPVEKERFRDLFLVHGYVTPPNGVDANKKIDHAWVQIGDFYIECASDSPVAKIQQEYTNHYKAIVRKKYTLNEAKAFLEKSKMYGPWDDEARLTRGLAPLTP